MCFNKCWWDRGNTGKTVAIIPGGATKWVSKSGPSQIMATPSCIFLGGLRPSIGLVAITDGRKC